MSRNVAFLPALVLAIAGQSRPVEDVPTSQPARPRSGKAVRSPEVSADGRITFRFRAPHADQVVLAISGQPPAPMTKDEAGTWQITTDPLPADFYAYQYYVDGVAMADPANPLNQPIVTGGHESLAHVPGPASLAWEVTDVPRGVLHRHVYASSVLDSDNEFVVYTPPGYDARKQREYPVLYLLHGVMGDAQAWSSGGRANVILDNLIARQEAVPMLVVMPLGYGFARPADRVGELFHPMTDQRALSETFADVLLNEVVVRVEREYRVKADREARAIAGLSMGGAQAAYLGLNHPEQFGWIGAFSGAYIMFGGRFDAFFPKLSAEVIASVRLLWIACGSEDFLIGPNRAFQEWLKSKDVRFSAVEVPGGHEWPVWRRNLVEFASLAFRAK